MADYNTTAVSLSLPPEIWRIVLHNFGTRPRDLVQLWTGCRGVSKHFKHEVEELFIADYLPLTSLKFAITTSRVINRTPTFGFRDYEIHTVYSRISTDRTMAFFQAQCDKDKKVFRQMHNEENLSASSHFIDLVSAATPQSVSFHSNGDVQVGWRELFAALFAEEKYHYQTGGAPVHVESHEDGSRGVVTQRRMSSIPANRENREAAVFESNGREFNQVEASRARIFRILITRRWY